MTTDRPRQVRKPIPASYSRTSLFYFSDTKMLRERITEWDPETERQGTIEAFATRLQNTENSQDWRNMSKAERSKEEPRRTKLKGHTLAKRSLERALKGQNVAEYTAEMITSELGSTFDDLGVIPVRPEREPQLPSPTQIGVVMELAKQIAFNWLTQGNEVHPDTCLGAHGIPAHPELIYRVSGEWENWNSFLGVDDKAPEAARNHRRDVLEDYLYDLTGMVLALARNQTRRIRVGKESP